MLTNKGKYGIKALVHLARLEPGESAQIAEIAQRNTIPKKFLDAILLDLRKAGLLRSKKGPGGGYALALPAREIAIGDVIRVLEGPIAPIACASRSGSRRCEDCDLDNCPVRMTMGEVRDAMVQVVDGTTLADLVRRTPLRHDVPGDYAI